MSGPLIAPASYAQERIWLDSQMDPDAPVYTIVTGLDLPAEHDPEQIRRWLATVVERHEALRTGLELRDGELVQVVLRHLEVPPIPVTDLSGLPAAQWPDQLSQARQEELARPFVLDRPPLWRARLLRRDTGWHLMFAVHHTVFDGESVVRFGEELLELAAADREGRPPRLPELEIQYPDFAAWQRGLVHTESGQEQLTYWRHRLADLPPVHSLPLDHPRPSHPSHQGDDVFFPLPEGFLPAVRELARRYAATEQAVLLAAYVAVLATVGGHPDVVVGVPAQGRDRAELRPLIGMFVNTLVIRVDASGDPTFAELLRRVQERLFEAWDNQDIPLQLLVQELAPARQPGCRPMFQLSFNHLKGVTTGGGMGVTADELALVFAGEQARLTYRTDLFTRATAERLVDRYLRTLEQALADPDTPLSQLAVDPLADAGSVPAPVTDQPSVGPGRQRYPLSFSQERLWVLEGLAPGDPVYNMPLAIRLRGRLDVAALRTALDLVTARHATLRTTFVELDGTPYQLVSPASQTSLPVADLTHLPEDERATVAKEMVVAEARQPFDLTTGPLLRTRLLRLADDEHILMLTMHHIVGDGWSLGVLLDELSEGYRATLAGQEPSLPALPVSYGDFAVWQREQLAAGDLSRQLEYWLDHLSGAPALLELPTERPRPAEETFAGEQYRFSLPGDVTERLTRLAAEADATPFMVLLAAMQVTLARYSGQRDIVIGTPVAGRGDPALEPMIGLFINTLALRGRLTEDMTFRQLLAQARETTLNGLSHQDLPFEKLVEALRPERNLSHSPVFQVQLIVQNTPSGQLRLPGLTASGASEHSRTAKFDLTVEVSLPPGEPARVHVEYKSDLFSRAWAERFGESLTTVLRAAVDDPDVPVFDLELLSPRQQAEVLVEPNRTEMPIPTDHVRDELLTRLASGQARVVARGVEVPGPELVDRTARLATVLRRHGIGPDTMVGLCLDRSASMLVGVLGVWQAGGGYVPLDPAFPPDRLRMMVEDSGLPVIVTCASHRELATELAAGQVTVVCLDDPEVTGAPPLAEPVPLHPDNLAYAIYTSGSTGRPKGVQVPHRPVANLLYWFRDALELSTDDTLVAVTTLSFDISVLELLLPPLAGCRMVIADQEQSSDPGLLRRLLEEHRATVLQATPATWRMLVTDGPLPDRLRVRLCGGEPLPRDLADQLVGDGVTLWNVYGPTETTVWSAAGRVPTEGAIVVGPPLGNTSLYVLDRRLRPVPVGVVGEVFIGGDGLARGYHARPGLTAERFVPDPFSDRPGARMYRTGDLARRLPDGTLEFLGRADFQVKVRGFRIEIGEIEAAMSAHPAVSQAVVTADTSAGETRLVGYVVPTTAGATPAQVWPQLREHLRQQLPEYMLPATLVTLSELPLTPNGKVDRRALPAPTWGATEETTYVAPRTEVERRLVEVWAELLGVSDPIGVHDDFFSLGGHSLTVARLVARIRSEFGSQLSLREVFAGPTVAELARAVVAHPDYGKQVSRPLVPAASSPAPEPAPAAAQVPASDTGLAGLSDQDIERLLAAAMREQQARQARSGPKRYPLSPFQRRLWFLQQLAPDEATYTLPQIWPLPGVVDQGAVQRAWDALVARHSTLRTTFPTVDGEPVQEVGPPQPAALTVVDLSGEAPEQRVASARRLIDEEFRRPFDLTTGPLLRVILLRFQADEHLVVANLHHLIADAPSTRLLRHEFFRLYREYTTGVAADLPALPMEYGEYAAEQVEALDEQRTRQQLDYWLERLRGAPALLDLPTDRPRPAVQTFRGATYQIGLPPELTSAVWAFARRTGATPYVVLLAAFQLLMARYSGQSDVVVGTPVTVRPREELEQLVGLFVNTVAARVDLSGDPTLAELVAAVRVDVVAALEHADVPFERVIEELRPERSAAYNPVFQVMFVLNQGPEPVPVADTSATNRLAQEVYSGLPAARFDLTTVAEVIDGRLWLSFDYNADLFDESTMARMADHLATLLRAMTTDPQQRVWQVPLVSGDPAAAAAGRTITRAYPAPPVHELVSEVVAADPDALAVLAGAERLSYGELERRANQLAWRLHRLGVAPDQPVAVGLPAGPDALVGVLGILRAGGAYLPVDPEHPAARRAWLVLDAGAKVLVTTTAYADRFTDHPGQVVYLDEPEPAGSIPDGPPPVAVHPQQAAYVIYTSGSTGTPKGVVVPHVALTNLAHAFVDLHGFHAADRLLMIPPLSFDASVGDIFPALVAGAALVVHPEPAGLSGRELLRFCAEHEITVVDAPAALWQQWVNDLAEVDWPEEHPLAQMMVGGDVVPMEKVRAWARITGGMVELVNHYGPTEATVCATTYTTVDGGELGEVARLPVGAPVPNVRCYVLDRAGRPVPDGVPGEVYLGGIGVSRGYLGRPGLTAERFVPDPFSDQPGARMYRTGDRARWSADGRLEFLGRVDDQVKIRGHRVELREVEAAIAAHPQVREVAVVARPDATGQQILVGYVVPTPGAELTTAELRTYLRQQLPDYLVPSRLVRLAALPLTSHGKVDRAALPEPEEETEERAYEPPATPTEQAVAAVWAEVLGRSAPIGRQDGFFDLGGHSLQAVAVVTGIERATGYAPPVRALFQAPTLADLAALIDQARGVAPATAVRSGVDVRAEAVLPDDVCVDLPAYQPRPLGRVLLTGATGFLGAFLLDDLLRHTDATVFCLVRADSESAGVTRIAENLRRYELWRPEYEARIVPLPGDLTAPGLGLSADTRAALAQDLDAIYHNGGAVNFLHPYDRLKAANVTGTVEVLRLAGTDRPTPVHFVSTLGVFLGDHYRGGRVTEADSPTEPEGLNDGYNQSKWVADALVREAAARGLPVTIHRPARVAGDSRTGVSNPDDYFSRMLKTFVQLGSVPLWNGGPDLYPVDCLAAAIGQASRDPEAWGGGFHYYNRAALTYDDVAAALRRAGFRIRRQPHAQWREQLVTRVERGEDIALGMFAPLFPAELPPPDPSRAEPEFDCRRSQRYGQLAGAPCPPADVQLLRRYLDYFRRIGFLKRGPAGAVHG